MSMTTPATRATFAFAGLLVALAGSGCDAVEDFARDYYDHSQKGAALPPKDPPPVPQPPADTCASTEQCGPSLVCSVELGVCNSPPGCGPEGACPAVCYGTCVPRKDPPPPPPKGEPCGAATCDAGMVCCNDSCGICVPPGGGCTKQLCPKPEPPKAECATDADCRTFSNYCEGCACEALATGEKEPLCSGKIVACFADPCGREKAVCKAGQCVLASAQPERCVKLSMGGETSCKPADVWKKYSFDDCAQRGLNLSEISTREDCGGGTRYVDYVCCSN